MTDLQRQHECVQVEVVGEHEGINVSVVVYELFIFG
jgi:hypothetical protein